MGINSASDYAHLRTSLLNREITPDTTGNPIFDRLLRAMSQQKSYRSRTKLDLAVLIRHALRHEATRRDAKDTSPLLEIPHFEGMPDPKQWRAVSITAHKGEQGECLTSLPWKPDWLLPNEEPADEKAARAAKLSRGEPERHSPDLFLRELEKEHYRSPGQRTAVRTALTMPSGSTLLITLPTGEGKSLVFDSLGHFGAGNGVPGVIPVIVPTVALALDHEKSIQERLKTDRPFAYVGGANNRHEIKDAIERGEQGLCFMAPEAACGALQDVLLKANRTGLLTAFVIDEAHLVEAWGSDFRTDFPMLSALRAKMMADEESENQVRTILLSATLTQMAVDTLAILFSDGKKPMAIVNGVRLRPELHFYTARNIVSEEDRRRRVLEAVAHLPRPLILYASTPDEVKSWHAILQREGYGNLAQFHGRTSPTERGKVLQAWRDGTLDMVVGNSAFGLGIDFPHVRTVVHACMPETLDRFYQEVGRGGRDGCSSVSILIPAHNDRHIAESLNRQKIITLERGRQRWLSMFEHPDRETLKGSHKYRLRLNVAPSVDTQDIDQVSLRSTDWNARILTVMARAGLIRILRRNNDKKTGYPWAEVEIIRHDHMEEAAWDEIRKLRTAIRANNDENLKAIKQYISGATCPAPLLSEIYTTDRFAEHETIVPVCSGCPACGVTGNSLNEDPPVPAQPWPVLRHLTPHVTSRFDHNNLLVVEYPVHNWDKSRFQRELGETFQNLHLHGFTNLFLLGPDRIHLPEKPLSFVTRHPFFVSRGSSWLHRSLLPPGPDIVFMLPDFIQKTPLNSGHDGYERLIFMPDSMRDPSRTNRTFLDAYSGNTIRFETFRLQVRT